MLKKIILMTILSSYVLGASDTSKITIGAKKFTEGNITAYILAQTIKKISPKSAVHVLENLGGTGIVMSSIKSNEIQMYVGYTGTLAQTFKTTYENLPSVLEQNNMILGFKLGFNNSYGLAVDSASPFKNISDLTAEQRLGISHEFSQIEDGYLGLKRNYSLSSTPQIIDYSLLQHSLLSNKLDVIEIYRTDAKIKKYQLKVLNDDKNFFPRYDAIVVYSKPFYEENRQLISKIQNELQDKINDEQITHLNYLVDMKGKSYQKAAQSYTKSMTAIESNRHSNIFIHLLEHIEYLIVTVFLCGFIGIPCGVLSAKYVTAERLLLTALSIMQTIPSLALLVFLIPFFGLGKTTCIIALFLYGLLPIVKGTHQGIKKIPQELNEFSTLISIPPLKKLLLIELPLAKSDILSGIKLTSIYCIGITVIAAFVGAGGLGTLIVTGLTLNDTTLILQGAIPAALLAIIVEIIFQKVIPHFSKEAP